MGVHGLWRLIEPSGKPVPLETLENKVLAVDISIWLHQAVKGFQDSKGAPLPNAHLLGIYHRVCKLLYFKIKPVFVFDGGVPALKKQTIAKRNQLKSKSSSEADRLQKQLLNTLLKHTAISNVLSEKTKASLTAQTKKSRKQENLYELPPSEIDSTISSSDEDEASVSTSDTTDSSPTKNYDLHTIDMTSVHFKSLPVDVRHEILTELKETRKQNSWGRLHELPKQSDDFSSYQMKRLLKRQSVQAALDEAAQEMGGASLSIAELESILKDQGIQTTTDNIGKRIASDENTRYLFIKDVKQAMEKARKEQLEKEAKQNQEENNVRSESAEKVEEESKESQEEKPESSISGENRKQKIVAGRDIKTKADLEEEEEIQKALALSLEGVATTSPDSIKRGEFSFLENFNDADFQSDDSDEEVEETPANKILSSAQHYMMEYSGLTPNEISKIISIAGQKQLNSKINKIQKTAQSELPPKMITILEQVDATSSKTMTESSEMDLTEEKLGDDKTEDEPYRSQEDIADGEVCEIMSDSEASSSSNEFVDVGDDKEPTNSLEIFIDPDEKQKGDDLFDDIFMEEKKVEENKGLTITIQPELKIDDDLFGDIFDEKMDEKKTPSSTESEPLSVLKENALSETKITNQSIFPKKSVGENLAEVDETENEVETEKVEIPTTEQKKSPEITQKPITKQLTFKEMSDMRDSLQREKTDLIIEKSNKERLASNITDQMYQEAQELLELFGMPYVIAPMEAEAQCAFLDEIELTDGTITDDSDIWLFGGRTVYKNFFNQSKYVMEFKAENIKHHFKLTREQMILLALLVGSDYTTGIQGVGPVTALEILSAFPPSKSGEFSLSQAQLISGLKEFRSWFNKGKTGGPGRASLKSKLKNITFTDNFPSLQVIQAYLDPKVEKSEDKFSWGKPDVVSLSLFARQKFGWGSKKTDEILNPVIKRLEENRSQKSIKEYFKTRFRVDSTVAEEKMSKRVKTAIGRFGKTQEELIAEEMEELEWEKQKTTRKTDKPTVKRSRRKQIEKVSEDVIEGANLEKECVEKKPRGKKTKELVNPEDVTEKANSESGVEKKSRGKKIKKLVTVINADKEKYGEGSKADEISTVTVPNRGRKKRTKIESIQNQNIETLHIENDNIEAPSIANNDINKPVDSVAELKEYENLAAAIRMRRKKNEEKKNDQIKAKKEGPPKKKPKISSKTLMGEVPKNLEVDEEIQLLVATTSRSLTRVEEIEQEVKKDLDRSLGERKRPSFHNKEVIHQRLRDKTDMMKNKMKAIEVFRKSKRGPGYVKKRASTMRVPREDAGLSEESE